MSVIDAPTVDDLESIPTQDEVGQVLNKAANLIEEHGWCRGARINRLGSLCAYGAIEKAVFDDVDPLFMSSQRLADPLMKGATARVRSLINNDPIPIWNDRIAGDKSTVVEILRKAAQCQ